MRVIGVRLLLFITTFAAACDAAEHLYDVVGLSLAIRRRFGGAAVYASLTDDARLSVVFSQNYQPTLDTTSRFAFADSIATFAVNWFGRKRLSAVTVTLTQLTVTQRRNEERAGEIRHFVFVPEYEPDGSMQLMHVDAGSRK